MWLAESWIPAGAEENFGPFARFRCEGRARRQSAPPIRVLVDRARQVGLFGRCQNVFDCTERKARGCAADIAKRSLNGALWVICRRRLAGSATCVRENGPKRMAVGFA